MPKFKVLVQQYVEEQATLEIEAATAEEAMVKGHDMLRNGEVEDWHDGDDIKDDEVYSVLDANDNIVWER